MSKAWMAIMISMSVALSRGAAELVSDKTAGTEVENAVSIMLVGSITLQMCTFYIVNHGDSDIRFFAWLIIGTTLQIFCAVLFYQAINGCLKSWVIAGNENIELPVHFAHMLFWFAFLQGTIGYLAGSCRKKAESKDQEKVLKEVRELDLKCFPQLLSHVTGFAAITAWGDMQHLSFFSVSPWSAMLAAVVACCSLSVLFNTYWMIRKKIGRHDGGYRAKVAELWDEESLEAGHDILCMAGAFLMLQAVRFKFIGKLPNLEGVSEGTTAVGLELSVVCLSWAICAGMLAAVFHKFHMKKNEDLYPFLSKFMRMMKQFAFMSVAWSLLFAAMDVMKAHGLDVNAEGGVAIKVVLALFLSLTLLVCVFFLNRLSHLGGTSPAISRIIAKLIESMGLCIGLSWERCFDAATDSLAEMFARTSNTDEASNGLFLAVLVCGLVAPAYRWYILPQVVKSEEVRKQRKNLEMANKEVVRSADSSQKWWSCCQARANGYMPLAAAP